MYLVFVISLVSLATADQAGTISIDDVARIRCSTNKADEAYTVFNGTIYSWVPGERQIHLFDFVGLRGGFPSLMTVQDEHCSLLS
jgi:hypothetical protein